MTGRAGKTRNIFLVWLIWPLITLGIYHFVWWYKINREARDFDENIDVQPVLSLLAILIGWVIIVPPFVSIYRTGTRIAKMQEDAGMDVSCNGWLGLVLSFFAGLHSLYYQYELNLIWARLGYPEEGSLIALPMAAAAVPASRPQATPTSQPQATPASEPQATPTSQPQATPTNDPQAAPTSDPQAARSGGTGRRGADEPSNTSQDNGGSPAAS
jgi:4-amino-4-deoxy-L-arabinose transferase-like glycosyltransferase